MVIPKIYSAFIKDTTLEDIRLISVDSAFGREPGEGKSYNINLKAKFPFKKDESDLFVFPSYNVYFEDDEPKDAGIIKFKCVFSLHYKVKNILDYQDDIIKAFADNNAKFNSWSYFRELFSSVTMRMGIGPLVVPLLKPAPPERLVSAKR